MRGLRADHPGVGDLGDAVTRVTTAPTGRLRIASRVTRIIVLGVAQPKGSTRAFVPKGWTRPIITSANKSLKGWEDSIRAAAQEQCAGVFYDGPIVVGITFYLPRPKSLPKRETHHVKRPDLDKLVRSLDALTGVLWKDDSQITMIVASKTYAVGQPQTVIEVESI